MFAKQRMSAHCMLSKDKNQFRILAKILAFVQIGVKDNSNL